MTNKHTSYHSITRRAFLKLSSVSLISSPLAGCTHKKFFNPDDNIILSTGNFMERGEEKNALIAINLDQTEKRLIETPFLPHGIYINPQNKYRIFCFEKNGTKACEIDLQAKRVTRIMQADQNQLFSGHACFSHDGNKIISIEVNNENQQGIISIRDTNTFNVSKKLPTLGLSPHDCQLSESNVLTISNTGRSESGFHQPALVSIDLNSEKLIERIKLESNNLRPVDLNCGHFKITQDKDIVIASAPVNNAASSTDVNRPGGISIRKHKESIQTMREPEVVLKRMTGEALSIEVSQRHAIAAVTHPQANLLTFWSIKDKKIIKAYGFDNPRGLSQTLDKKAFVLSYGKKPAMTTITISDLTPQIDSVVQPTHASGEHIINWSQSLREIMPKQVYD